MLWNVVIADVDKPFRKAVEDALNEQGTFRVAASVSSGQDAVNMVERIHPDIVLMDTVLPELDGMSVLNRMSKMEFNRPEIIIASHFINERCMEMAMKCGVYYYMQKPCAIESLIERMNQAVDSRKLPPKPSEITDLNIEVSLILREIGVPAHVKGYQYLREAIMLSVKDISMINMVTKCLYPEVARRYHSTASRVERSIRHAIEIAWNRGELSILQKFFGHPITYMHSKPTNSEFIAMIADYLRLRSNQQMA